tara:strand:- start:506 stop:1471 length:966 start_codon:yes stop_codon:yes gene_type:complete
MNTKIILVILGEPNSTFSEILLKYFKSKGFKKNKNKIILIGNKKLFQAQAKKLNYNIKVNEIKTIKYAIKGKINILNINYKFTKAFSNITDKSNQYIEECFDTSIKLMKKYKIKKLINGPVSKKNFLKRKFPGITEYIGKKTHSKDQVMLIYNEKISVSPLTTHIPIKNVSKVVKKNKIIKNLIKIDTFFKSRLGKTPYIAVLGLNPHCESTDKVGEEQKEIIPAINFVIKKNLKVDGPISADTFFLDKNIKKYDVVLGMYHDQVLTPIKTLFKFEAINITLGLPFIKVTPDHGPNIEMIGQNKSDPTSIFYAFNFLNKLK